MSSSSVSGGLAHSILMQAILGDRDGTLLDSPHVLYAAKKLGPAGGAKLAEKTVAVRPERLVAGDEHIPPAAAR